MARVMVLERLRPSGKSRSTQRTGETVMDVYATAGRSEPPTNQRALLSDDLVVRDAENFSLVLGGPLYQL